MDKGSNGRVGKIVTAGHSTRVEGLNKFLDYLEAWPEIKSIRIGPIQVKKTVGRKSNKLKTDRSRENGLRAVHGGRRRSKGGGGFAFKATRPAVAGLRITGINCQASYGKTVQQIVLTGDNLDALKARLHAEGFGATW